MEFSARSRELRSTAASRCIISRPPKVCQLIRQSYREPTSPPCLICKRPTSISVSRLCPTSQTVSTVEHPGLSSCRWLMHAEHDGSGAGVRCSRRTLKSVGIGENPLGMFSPELKICLAFFMFSGVWAARVKCSRLSTTNTRLSGLQHACSAILISSC